ncbi:MAG: SUMF1/EgtB/PvdO family nonheme iron enzyme, partial [Paludibacteraceae bacterium]|nr:SUMF1/EgtB/PvdO family nonheme iron enzyme [Paludibacteraceae bacterium]
LTGNVSEWCQDIYGPYTLSTQPDPCGADTGRYRIARGSNYDECVANSHLSVRHWYLPETATEYIGLRVALTLPNEPMLQVEQEEPPLTRSVRIKGKKLRFVYVPAEEPYYISEEVECALWKKIMRKDPPDNDKSIALRMSKSDRTRFAEYCSRIANEALLVASAEQIVLAEQQHLIETFQPDVSHKRKKETIRSIQRRRRAVDKLSPWTELVGVRLPKPDDPVLLQFKKADDESRPLRLVISIR